MIGTLGVIVIMNLLYYSYIPLVPVFADKVLGVGPTLLGVLASSQGFGAFLTAIFITTRPRINRNSTYFVVGTAVAFSGLLVFSLSRFYPLSVVGLILAGLGMSGFVSMVFTLVLLSVGEEMRGRAMGFANTGDRDIAALHAGVGLACRSDRPRAGGVAQRLDRADAEHTVVVPLQGDEAALAVIKWFPMSCWACV